jgi:peptidyl-prolyl cis-trans isomerase D
MAGDFNKKTGVRILFGVVIGLLAVSMLLYLVPQGPSSAETSTDVVARVGDQTVTLTEVRQRLDEIRRNSPIPKQFEAGYARQILDQLVFQKEKEYEAKRMGITVSEKERADRIRMYVPSAFNGDTFVGMDAYAREVQQRFQLTVPVFEELVRTGLVEEKFRKLITDGISVGPAEIQDEFRYQNEKVKLDYVLIKPDDLRGKVNADEAEIKAYYDKSKANFQIPEKRSARYALLDLAQLRQTISISDDKLKEVYEQNIQQYQVPNRVHAEHILFMTVGDKTDAEIEEIRKKATDVLAQAHKKGANFEELAKKYSEDPGSKAKGGDLGWIMQGQTVPEFEKTAFSLNKGETSGLIRTQYGFHIIKVLDKETAHTTPFEDVKDSIRAPLLLQQVDTEAGEIADKISAEIRQSRKTTLDGLAQKYHLNVADTRPLAANDSLLELSNSQEVKDELFRLHQGDLSLPIRTDRGYVVISVQQVIPTHQGTLEEVREKVLTALTEQKAAQLAQAKASDLIRRVKAGEKFDSAARALGLDPKTSEAFARGGSVPNVASGKQLSAAFSSKPGEVGSPIEIGANWVVYQVVEKTEANPADFEKQRKSITDTLLQSKRTMAFDAFRAALEERMKKEGTLKLMPEKMRGFGGPG